MSTLYISCSARKDDSNSRTLGNYLTEKIGGSIISRDLGANPLPPISAEDLIGVHGSLEPSSESMKAALDRSNELIDELKSADTLVIATPMYNFGVPATLKQWIDAVCRARVTFKYTEEGPVGLTGIQRAYIITASGGTPIGSDMDFVSPYLEHICRFIGVKDVVHIDASGSKGSTEEVITQGKAQIDDIV